MKRFYLIGLAAVIALLIALPALARSQTAPAVASYEVSWYTIDGGGVMNASGGAYSLSGTIGQPDAGALSGGSYTLAGGFWGGAVIDYKVFLPLTLKSF